MFGASSADDNMRGMATFSNMIPLDDPELEAKKKARAQRRKNGITLDDCLNEFGKEEILSEMDTWYCPRCKEHQRASKKFELWKTPDILVMHLKRFSSSQNRRDKLDVFVDFPIEGLDLTSRVIETEEGKQEIYDLFAVDDHWGGLGGGHYTAFAKNFVDNEWYEYNGKLLQAWLLNVRLTTSRCVRLETKGPATSSRTECLSAVLPTPIRRPSRWSEIQANP
jgi:ubiquitin carboxyl-terminal hydrolase 4/11/15